MTPSMAGPIFPTSRPSRRCSAGHRSRASCRQSWPPRRCGRISPGSMPSFSRSIEEEARCCATCCSFVRGASSNRPGQRPVLAWRCRPAIQGNSGLTFRPRWRRTRPGSRVSSASSSGRNWTACVPRWLHFSNRRPVVSVVCCSVWRMPSTRSAWMTGTPGCSGAGRS